VKVFALYNIKGGVGKTASAVNLAYLSAWAGHPTLVWDLDPQASATFYFRVRPKVKGGARRMIRGQRDPELAIRGSDYEGLDLLPADFSYRHMDLALERTARPVERLGELLAPLEGEYEHVFLDCPPSISRVSESVFAAADALLVPTIPTPLSLRTLAQLIKHLKGRGEERPRVMPFLCMVDRRKALHREIERWARAESRLFLDASIPYSSQVEQMGTRRKPLCAYAAGSPPARAYEALWKEIGERARRVLPAGEDRRGRAVLRSKLDDLSGRPGG